MLKYHGVPITPFIFVAINFMVVTRPPPPEVWIL